MDSLSLRRRCFRAVACLFVSLLTFSSLRAASASPAPAGPLTVEELFRPWTTRSPELSQDGSHLALLVTDQKDRRVLQVIDLASHASQSLGLGEGIDVSWFFWVHDDRLFYQAVGDKTTGLGTYIVPRDQLNRPRLVLGHTRLRFLGLPDARPDRIIANLISDSLHPELPGRLVEISTLRPSGEASTSLENVVYSYSRPADLVTGWLLDRKGELAGAISYAKGSSHAWRFEARGKNWTPLALDLDVHWIHSVDADGHSLWTSHYEKGPGFVLCKYNMDTGAFEEPVFADANYDLRGATTWHSRAAGQLAGIVYEQRRLRSIWLLPGWAAAQKAVDQANPDGGNRLVSVDDKDAHFVFRVGGAAQPGAYVLYDAAAKTVTRVGRVAPWLDGRKFAVPQPISFHSRDGLALEGYLTLPEGASKEHPVPMVVRAHDGPWSRVDWAFDPEVQFLASRGYAVLEPNYRGSTGYARAVSFDARGDFRHMSDDISDAVRAVLGSGVVDPQRVAIMGEHFGGYLALCGLAFDPALYRCGIGLGGVYDWQAELRKLGSIGQAESYQPLRDRIGEDPAQLDAISPVKHLEGVHAPFLVATTSADISDASYQSHSLVDALKAANRPYDTFFLDSYTRGFANEANHLEYYRRVEAFLAKNLTPSPR